MLHRIFRAYAMARTKSALRTLTDAQLNHIGIDRRQINSHVNSMYEVQE